MEAILCSVVIVVAIFVVKFMLTPREYNNDVSIASDTEFQVLTICVSPTSKWVPNAAIGLVGMLVKLSVTQQTLTTLRIYARDAKIRFQVVVDSDLVDQVKRAVLSFYPDADIADGPLRKAEPSIHFLKKYCGVIDFFAPLAYADEFSSVDPLTGVVAAMAHLEDGEMINYAIQLSGISNVGYDWKKYGTKMLSKSSFPLLLEALALSASNKRVVVTKPRSLDKFEKPLQTLFQEKVGKSIVTVFFSVYAEAATPERCQRIIQNVENAMSVFDRPDSNMLIEKSAETLVLGLCPQEIAALWHLPTDQIKTPGVVWSSGAKAPLPVELLGQTGDLLLGHNTYQGQTQPVYLANPDRITHMNIVGKTRVGKTTFMHNLIHQDIREGRGVAVIDPHGDLVRDILESSIPSTREEDVVLFDLADTEHPVPLNLLYVPRGVPRHAAVGMTLGVLKRIFAEQWSATRMEDALYSALAVLVDHKGATIRDIPKVFLNEEFRRDVLRRAQDEVALEYFHEDYEQMSERYQLEVARPIMNRIRAFYRNPVIRAIVDQPESLDMRAIMDGRKIFLASLAGEATQAEASVIGSLLISKIQMAAMSRASQAAERRRIFYLYIDEVQNFVTTSLPVMFSEAAKYALSLTVANQFLRQLAGDTLEAVLGNTGTTVMFASGSQDARDLGAYVKPVFDSETLLNLDRFQTVVKMQKDGKTLPAFNMATPAPPEKPVDAQERAARIREKALSAYTQDQVEEKEETPEHSVPEMAVEPTDGEEGDVPTLQL